MSGEVRLWREPVEGPPEFIPENPGDPVTERSYIALHAAEFEAWRRVMLAARCWRDTVIFPNEENGSEVDLCAAVDAYLATAPSRQGEAPRE